MALDFPYLTSTGSPLGSTVRQGQKLLQEAASPPCSQMFTVPSRTLLVKQFHSKWTQRQAAPDECQGKGGKVEGEQSAESESCFASTLLPLAVPATNVPSTMLSSAGKSISADRVADPPAFFSTHC